MRKSIVAALGSTEHHRRSAGCFVSACITHVETADNEHHDEWDLLAAGHTPRGIAREWFFGAQGEATRASRQLIEPCAHYPCNPRCHGFTRRR